VTDGVDIHEWLHATMMICGKHPASLSEEENAEDTSEWEEMLPKIVGQTKMVRKE